MCQYRYDYYGYCQHQEFILVKLCEDAISLARSDKHQTKHNTEGAIVQAPPTDTTTAPLRVVESNFNTTKPSIVPGGEVDRPIYSSSTIIHIIVRFVVSHACAFKSLIIDIFTAPWLPNPKR
jgi:hypothetical protein